MSWTSFHASLQPHSNLRRALDWVAAFCLPFVRAIVVGPPLPQTAANFAEGNAAIAISSQLPSMVAIHAVFSSRSNSHDNMTLVSSGSNGKVSAISAWHAIPAAVSARELAPIATALRRHAVESSAVRLIDRLFDLVRDCDEPDAAAALGDLAACCRWTYPHLVQRASARLRASLQARLLHAGANTRDVLTQYMSLARVLLRLDPAGMRWWEVAETGGGVTADPERECCEMTGVR